MSNKIQKEAFSKSIKLIKKELNLKSIHNYSHQQIQHLVSESFGYDSYEKFIDFGFINHVLSYSIQRLLYTKETILNKIKEKTEVEITTFWMIDQLILKHHQAFYTNHYYYNLAQYIMYYDLLFNKKTFDESPTTYQYIYENMDKFIYDFYFRYNSISKDIERGLMFNLLTKEDLKEYPELYVIIHKKEQGLSLSCCDEIFLKSINNIITNRETKEYNIADKYMIKNLTDEFKTEIVRLKSLQERKINYKSFIYEIPEFVFYNKDYQAEKEIDILKNKIKSKHLYLGVKGNEQLNDLKKDALPILHSNFFNKNKFFKKENTLNLHQDILNDGLYIAASIGSGFNAFLFPIIAQNWLNNEINIFFDTYGDNSLALKYQNIKNHTTKSGDIVLISHSEFLEMNEDKIISLLKKEKSLFFNLPSLEKTAIEDCLKICSKISYFFKILKEFKRQNTYNIFINDFNSIYKNNVSWCVDFKNNIVDLKNKDNIRLFLRGDLYKKEVIISEFNNVIIMKNECFLDMNVFKINGFNNYINLERNIRNLYPCDFIFAENREININDPIYKAHCLNFYYGESIAFQYDFNL